MKLVDSDTLDHSGPNVVDGDIPVPGPSTGTTTNGYLSPTAISNGFTNGSSGKHSIIAAAKPPISRVNLPGKMLYDNSNIKRDEFVRLVIQSLRDAGYMESAATLEEESGYTMEGPQVAQFRRYVLEGHWREAEEALKGMGVVEPDDLISAKLLISTQKYLELLEQRHSTAALYILRNEIAPLTLDMERLHTLSSYMMCSTTEDVFSRSQWDGAAGTSRRELLIELQRYIPSSTMIPVRRLETLLNQSREYQCLTCTYHNVSPSTPLSLLSDHKCTRADFPTTTTFILAEHDNEVWHVQWSHDGRYLASGSKDGSAIIWKFGAAAPPVEREITVEHTLRDHAFGVTCLAWSPDDKILLTASERVIKLWVVKTGVCCKEIQDGHTDDVMALVWLPDGSGFLSGGMDRRIITWNPDGTRRDVLFPIPVRVADLTVTPDQTRMVAVGINEVSSISAHGISPNNSGGSGTTPAPEGVKTASTNRSVHEHLMVVFNLTERREEATLKLDGELTSIKAGADSRYVLINRAPDELQMWDLQTARMTRKFTGQRQGKDIIRSCFGGAGNNFVVSGSEDGSIYVWHKNTGALLEILKGHGRGSVNSVAWHPLEERTFASCSDDGNIHIWEPLPSVDYELDSGTGSGRARSTVVTSSDKGKMRHSSMSPQPASSSSLPVVSFTPAAGPKLPVDVTPTVPSPEAEVST